MWYPSRNRVLQLLQILDPETWRSCNRIHQLQWENRDRGNSSHKHLLCNVLEQVVHILYHHCHACMLNKSEHSEDYEKYPHLTWYYSICSNGTHWYGCEHCLKEAIEPNTLEKSIDIQQTKNGLNYNQVRLEFNCFKIVHLRYNQEMWKKWGEASCLKLQIITNTILFEDTPSKPHVSI